ncbi:polysialyltransferase family glycosyltransferase [Streptomyces salinarius]|uniref:polysialyltransferase family glycosyltransferase n=1 Tax=Streptomyces salinarius TaxID=2762598 RepID=UPI0013DC2DFC|nr:polysialyltransferase family glycosyltransferase [Streptomyces salinarius]
MAAVQLFFACSQYAAATVAAALRSGLFGPRADHRRVLVVSDRSAAPEAGVPLDRMAGFAALRPEFDEVRSWNDFVRPFRPADWAPRDGDEPLWERALRQAWGLGDGEIEIACESVQGNPSGAAVRIFAESRIHVYADGLMSYGPTRVRLDPRVGARVERLLYVDLVPGLRPLLLTEFGVRPQVVPTEAVGAVLRELADHVPELPGESDSPALLLGQYLSASGLMDEDEEEALQVRMVRGVVALGHRDVVFKPHPAAPPGRTRVLAAEAERLGARLRFLHEPVLAEAAYRRLRPALVAGCFSTGLFTAARFFGLPVARTGTETLLRRLSPYQNGNRVPLTLVDALLPDLADPAAVAAWSPPGSAEVGDALGGLLPAVGFAMQPELHPGLRTAAERWLGERPDAAARYVTRRRLTALGLPGGTPSRLAFLPRTPAVRRVARRVRSVRRAVTGSR